jgi:hypothetical protein
MIRLVAPHTKKIVKKSSNDDAITSHNIYHARIKLYDRNIANEISFPIVVGARTSNQCSLCLQMAGFC